jgi:hypothetical protein
MDATYYNRTTGADDRHAHFFFPRSTTAMIDAAEKRVLHRRRDDAE